MNLYLELFHGRNKADEELDEWGFAGPIVGPVYIGWTYGNVKLIDEEGDMIHLPQTEDMVHLQLDGKDEYYGDMAVISNDNPALAKLKAEQPERFLTYDQFKEKYKLTF